MRYDPAILKKYQIWLFLLTYIGYSSIHFQREGWALSKKFILKEEAFHGYLGVKMMSRVDSIQLLAYGIAMYVGGALGDIYD